jgi:hypothetical protein
MEKVHQILGVLKKHHFWIFSVVVSAAILGCWYTARASLTKKYEAEKSAIEQQFSALQTIRSNELHPNPDFKTGVDVERQKLKQTTDAEWQRLYDRQKGVFIWPEALPAFKEWEDKGRKEPMTLLMRQQYQGFIDREFPKLEQLVDVRREKYPQGTTGSTIPNPAMRSQIPMTGGIAGPEMIGIVEWDQNDFMRLQSNLKTWNTTTPTQREVELCHESLAIYRSLLEAIRKVNSAATDNENAIVKRIIALDIGKDASVPGTYDVSNVIMPSELVAATGTEGGGAYPTVDINARQTEGPLTGEQINKEQMLLDDRYLDGAGAPVKADAALNSPPFAEFKLMKVRLLLVVNQKGIPTLLAELANAKLGVEVHQVRVNPQNSTVVQSVRGLLTATGGGASSGSPYGGRREGGGAGGAVRAPVAPRGGGAYGPSRGGAYGPSGGGGRREGGGAYAGASSGTTTESPNDATIEIKGIIYIYNPCNPEKTGSGTDTTNVDQRTMFGFAGASGAAGGAGATTTPPSI